MLHAVLHVAIQHHRLLLLIGVFLFAFVRGHKFLLPVILFRCGQLIVLMADHQTTGGYPRLAHVSSPSLPSLAQSKPGDEIRFRFINQQAGEDNLLKQQK